MSFLSGWNEAAIASLGLFWTALWAFCLGYLVSSMIQVFVTRERMQQYMGKEGVRSMALGTFFGFISSSCSFAALSGARALFAKGAGLAPALAFLLSSTNLVIELGIIIAEFLDWQFVVAEYVGGVLLIFVMWALVHATTTTPFVETARQRAREQEGGAHDHGCHHHHQQQGGSQDKGKKKIKDEDTNSASETNDEEQGEERQSNEKQSDENNANKRSKELLQKWGQVAMQYYMEWAMVWKDVTVGFTIAGIIAAFVPRVFYEWLFIGGDDPNFWQLLEHCLVGPVAAFFTFIGSMGNIPLAAVLYSNGVSFAGIISFIFSDLVVLPVLRVNAKYYGWKMALYILGVFLIALVLTSLVLHYVFEAIGILPSTEDAEPVTGRDYFHLNYTFGLNIAFILMSIVFFGWHFYQNGWSFTTGSSTIEKVLFFLAVTCYLWIVGGLFAGLAE